MVTINILGHLQVFQMLLTGLQMIFHPTNGSTDWSNGGNWLGVGPVALLALTFALLHISTKGIWTQKMQVHHVGMMLAMYAALFVPTVNVDIHDLSTGQDATVNNIPIGIAYPAAAISALATDAANQLGTAFQSVSATNPPLDLKNGLASPLRLMLAMRHFYAQAAATNPTLATNLARFVQQCVYPTANSIPQFQWSNLQKDQNLANTLFTTALPSPPGFVTMENMGGAMSANPGTTCTGGTLGASCSESCTTAQADLRDAFNAWMNGTGPGTCQNAAQAASARQDTKPLTDCNGSANASIGPAVGSVSASGSMPNLLSNTANFGSQFISQMYLACLSTAGWQMGLNGSVGENNPITLPSYCVIQSNAQNGYNVENAASANMFVRNMTSMMSILQFLFYALAPLSAAVMLFAGAQGVGIFTKYLMFGLWTQSWFPVAAILNNYGQMTSAEMLNRYGIALNGNGTPTAGVLTTISGLPETLMHVQNILGNVDMMMALTPVITMIVFTGSYMAMSGMAQDINAEQERTQTGALKEEAPSVGVQEQYSGVRATGNPMAPGTVVYGPGATSETMSAASGLSIAREAARTDSASTSMGLANAFSRVVQAGESVRLSNGQTLTSSVANSVLSSYGSNTSVGHVTKALEGAKLSRSEQLSVIAGLSAVTKGVFQSARATGSSVTEAAEQAGEAAAGYMSKIAKMAGGAVGKALEGVSANISTNIASGLSTEQGRSDLWEVGNKTMSEMRRQSQNSLTAAHQEGNVAELNNAINDAHTASATMQNTIAHVASMKEAAQRTSAINGSTSVDPVKLDQAYVARYGAQANQLEEATLMKLYGGNAEKLQKDLAQMQQIEPNKGIAMSRLIIRGINGMTKGLSADHRFEAQQDAFAVFDGTQTSTGQDASNLTKGVANEYQDRAAKTGQSVAGTVGAVQSKTNAAGKKAATASGRVNGGDPVTAPTGVSSDLSGGYVGVLGGRAAGLQRQGEAEVNEHSNLVPDQKTVQSMNKQAADNLHSGAMAPVEWMDKNLGKTAAAIAGFNLVTGAFSAGGAALAGAAFKKIVGGLRGGGAPGGPGAGPMPEGGGPGEYPTRPGGGLPSGEPTRGLGGPGAAEPGIPGPETPLKPGQVAANVLDKEGNVIGKTVINVSEVAGMSDRAVGEMLAARFAGTGATALAIGGSVLRLATGPVGIGAQLLIHSPEANAGETQDLQRLQGTTARAQVVQQLLQRDPAFAAQAKEVEQQFANGQGDNPSVRQSYDQLQARIDQAVADPSSIPPETPLTRKYITDPANTPQSKG